VIKKCLIFILEGAVYGFLGGALVWLSLYLIYETRISIARNIRVGKVTMSFLSFPVEFLPLCLLFMGFVFCIRLVVGFFFQKYNDLFLSWLLTGVISVIAINLILSDGPVSVVADLPGYFLWLITFLLITIYTVLFFFLRKALSRYLDKRTMN
jgi:hypothetical protein